MLCVSKGAHVAFYFKFNNTSSTIDPLKGLYNCLLYYTTTNTEIRRLFDTGHVILGKVR